MERYVTMEAIGKSITLIVDTMGEREAVEITGANHANNAERIALLMNFHDGMDKPSSVQPELGGES